MTIRAHIVGWGKSAPQQVVTNDDLAQLVDTSDEWIRTRTGIGARHIAADGETTFTLAFQAAQQALEVAALNPSQLELVIVATITPDYTLSSTACLLQDALGSARAAAFDLSAGCTGFVYGLSVASDLIASGACENALVVGAETLSRIVNWNDRNTCVLFGDGAGAVVLRANGTNGGVLSTVLGSDGSGGNLLYVPAGGSRDPACHRTVSEGLHYIHMQGREVFRFAVRTMSTATRQVVEQAGLTLDDLKLVIPHQANQRIIEAATRSLKLTPEVVFSNLDRYGNTSAASIPIALCEAAENGRIEQGDVVVCVGFGAGLTWGAAAIRWSVPLPLEPPTRWEKIWRQFSYLYARMRSAALRFLRWLFASRAKD